MIPTLFLLEFHVANIFFEPTFQPIPVKDQILINIRFSNLINMDIDPEDFPYAGQIEMGDVVDYNLGKSYLFSYTAEALLSDLKVSPLELALRVDQKTEGAAVVKWRGEFIERMKQFDKTGTAKPVSYKENVALKDKSNENIANIELFMRVCFFGESIETEYQIQKENEKFHYIFKNPDTKNSFKCEKLTGGEQANVFEPGVSGTESGGQQDLWADFFGGGRKISGSPLDGDGSPGDVIQLDQIFQHTSGDDVSMCFRPPENNTFFDILNLMNVDKSTNPQGTVGKYKQPPTKPNQKVAEEDDPLKLTADKIDEKLCRSTKCQGVKMFKEFGIGPLAKSTLYNNVDTTIHCGISHIDRRTSNHGPYGVFARPKRLDEPFVPSKNALETKAPPSCPNRKERSCKTKKNNECPCRLRGEEDETVEVNMGKSYLFTYKPRNLISEFKMYPLEILLRVNKKSAGASKLAWRDDFIEMVNLFEKVGVVKAVDYSGDVELRNTSDELIGRVDLFLRLSCYGANIETQYQMQTIDETTEYIFKNPKNTNTFKIEKSKGSEIFPVVSLYSPVARNAGVADAAPQELWTELFGGGGTEAVSRLSDSPGLADGKNQEIPLTEIYQHTSADTVSMVFRPPEQKFFDLMNLMSAEISTNAQGTSVIITKEKQYPQNYAEHGNAIREEKQDPLELTADKINRKLCKNKDCPAAKLFKEFGIGPLATGKGLGTLYRDVEPPVQYGMSNTYGTMNYYGPYGLLSKSGQLDKPSTTSNDLSETSPPVPENCKCKQDNPCPYTLRLRGGGPLSLDEPEGMKSPMQECKSVMDQMDEILRAYKKALGPCGEATCPYAQNLAEESCKKLCEKVNAPEASEGGSCNSVPCNTLACPFSESSNKYPAGCGSPKCAYTKYKLGLVDDDAALELQFLPPAVSGKCGHPKCQYLLQPPLPPIHWDCPDPLPEGNCKNPCCPYLPPDLKKLKIPKPKRGPCGSLSCPYAIPPPCDAPTCPFRPMPCPYQGNQEKEGAKPCCQQDQQDTDEPEDCGDPECCVPKLKGEFTACGNPDCPFAKPKPKNTCPKPVCPYDARPKETHSCGNPNCPLASKPKDTTTCENPECPFAPKPKDTNMCANPECPFAPKPKDTNSCGNPDCPFASKPKDTNSCGNPDCPFASKPKDTNSCGNPDCPFASKQKDSNSCGNPDCPFASKKKDSNSCGNPDCPFASKQKDSNSCGNPDCPFASKQKDSNSCGNPDCPFASKQKDSNSCGNPDCPFASKPADSNSCGNPDCPFASKPKDTNPCDNPDCPFASKPKKDSNMCDNPDCPFASKPKDSDMCDNPDCPFASKPKSKSTCDNPDCPFAEKKESEVCDNPDCPYAEKKEEEVCDNPDCPFAPKKDICENPECPYQKQQKSICDDPFCPYIQPLPSCGIPNCPYEPVPMVFCPAKLAEFRRRQQMEAAIQKAICCDSNEEKVETVENYEDVNKKKRKSSDRRRSSDRRKSADKGNSGEKGDSGEKGNNGDEKRTSVSKSDNNGAKEDGVKGKNDGKGASGTKSNAGGKKGGGDEKGKGGKKGKRKRRGKFVYSTGDKYPGVKVGHKECVTPYFHVPAKMGWLWNVYQPRLWLKPRKGWKPGAIQRSLAARIRAHRMAKGQGMPTIPKFKKKKRGGGGGDSDSDIQVSPKPTLQIQKKEGAYWITMNPLKDPYSLAENENPYMDCTPMQFKITKNKKKKKDDDEDNDESRLCYCEEDDETSSSDSELDIEFTPPAGIIHPERFKKKQNVIHCDTQYDPKDFEVKKKKDKGKGKGKGKDKGGKGAKGGKKGKK